MDACRAVRPRFAQGPGYTITAWHVPSRLEWKIQRAAHDVATSLRVGAGTSPRHSLDFLRDASDEAARRDWHVVKCT